MSYTTIYKTFVIRKGDKYEAYAIVGESNIFTHNGNKEVIAKDNRLIGSGSKHEIEIFAGDFYDRMNRGGSYKGLQKTKKGFIESFFKTQITDEEYFNHGNTMEYYLNKNKVTKKATTLASANALFATLPKYPIDNINSIMGKKVLIGYKHMDSYITLGSFKEVNGTPMFFKSNSKKGEHVGNPHQYFYTPVSALE